MNMLLTPRIENASLRMVQSILNRQNELAKMPLNVERNENEVIFNFVIPGFTREEIKVSIEDGNLKISAAKESKNEDNAVEVKENEKLQIEWDFHSHSATYSLPKRTDLEKVSVKLENGILQVVLPNKKEDTKLLEIQ